MSYTFTQTGSEIQAILDRAEAGGQIDQDIAAKQDALTFDDEPTENSDNPVKSGGIYDAIQAGGATALGAYPTDAITDADVASFPDGADGVPVKSLTINIEPLQSGSGDPSPDNVRPISGWTGANIYRTGKNLWGGGLLLSDVKAAISNAVVNQSAQTVAYAAGDTASGMLYDGFKENTQYTIILTLQQGNVSSGLNVRVRYTDNTNATITWTQTTAKQTAICTTAAGKTVAGIQKIYASSATTTIYAAESGVFEGVLTVDDFEPFGEVILVDWTDEAGTVYGGTLNVTTGVLTVTQVGVNMGGLTWDVNANKFYAEVTGLPKSAQQSKVLCSCYPTVSSGNTSSARADKTIYTWNGTSRIIVRDDSYNNDYSAFKTAMNGQTVVYPLATPQTYQLDPVTVATLLGQNNIFCDTGSIAELTYRADTALYIQKLLNGGGTLSMASPSPSLSLGRVGVLAEPEASEPEETDEEAEQLEQAEEPEQTEEAEEE